MDDWDARVIDGIAAKRHVVTFDNRGVGTSEGTTPHSVARMARDAVSLVQALELDQVDLVGFSLEASSRRSYNNATPVAGPSNYLSLLVNRASMSSTSCVATSTSSPTSLPAPSGARTRASSYSRSARSNRLRSPGPSTRR